MGLDQAISYEIAFSLLLILSLQGFMNIDCYLPPFSLFLIFEQEIWDSDKVIQYQVLLEKAPNGVGLGRISAFIMCSIPFR